MSNFSITRFGIVTVLTGGRSSDGATTPGWWNPISGGSTDDDLCLAFFGFNILQYVAATGAISATIQFAFDEATPCFSLNGNPAISYNNLPAGFVISNGNFVSTVSYGIGGGGSGDSHSTLAPYAPQFDLAASDTQPYNQSNLYSGANITPTTFIGITFAVSLSGNNPSGISGTYAIDNGDITSDYVTQVFSFQVQNANTPVTTGSTVSVISPGPADPTHPLDLDTVETLDVTYTDENGDTQTINIPSFTVTELDDIQTITFTLPTIPDDALVLTIIAGTEFSGSVELGKRITINFENASGIYQLTFGKTTDTLYDVVDGTTVELAIPDPFFKTGFIGG